jgi:tetratricopeptide (TPR) repeat protein
MKKTINRNSPVLLCLSIVALSVAVLLFANPLAAAPPKGGGGHGGGHGGGGGGGHGGGGWSGSHGGSWSGGSGAHGAISRPGPAHVGHPGPAHITHPVHPVGPMSYHHGYYNHWYHGDWHDHYRWSHPWHVGPVAWWSAGFVTGAVVWDTPWRWGYWPYYNPYFTEVVVVDNTTLDYSRPIVVAPTAVPPAGQEQTDQQAEQSLDAARTAFSNGDYATAMSQVNQAIAKKPNDTVPHEFRALILFATKRYKEAAAAIYAVLSVGPGWDWATMSGFYPDVSAYTAQLRDLEQYRDANLKSPEVRFLLAYHYLSCGHRDAAIRELQAVVKLSPKDQLSAQMLAGLQQQDTSGTKPAPVATPPVPAKPVDAASLFGNWQATRSDGASFSLDVAKDGTYAWRHTLQGKSQTFSGAYTVADNLLILKEQGNPAMIGQISLLDATRFNFKLVGSNPSDPGLTFTKKP